MVQNKTISGKFHTQHYGLDHSRNARKSKIGGEQKDILNVVASVKLNGIFSGDAF